MFSDSLRQITLLLFLKTIFGFCDLNSTNFENNIFMVSGYEPLF